MAKFQLCSFRRTKDSNEEVGIAILNVDFGYHDIKEIIDENGNKIQGDPWDYKLRTGLGYCAIDTETPSF